MTSAAIPAPVGDALEPPRGLIPPTRRGRTRRMIGDVIVDLGLLDRETVEEAIASARAHGKTTGQVLLERGALRQDQLARALAERFGIDYVDLSIFEIDMGAVNLIPADLAKLYQAVPIGFLPHHTLLVAMADPSNVVTLDEITMITGKKTRPVAAARDDIAALIRRLSRIDDTVADVQESEPEAELVLEDHTSSDAPIIRLVHAIIGEAAGQGASDIHWEPGSNDMEVRLRVDGMLRPAGTVARSMSGAVVSRIKIMANLDIAERRAPQDGRLAMTIDGRRVDVRVVTLPLIDGEGVVMRLLDHDAEVQDLATLGMHDTDRERLVTAVSRPYGAVLVTGPTGSGKSTTVYGALGIINDGQRSILTIEDPVESRIAGLKQMQVSQKAGVTFANGLRSMLRADPDVIMVGEIRDRDTAEIAIQAALSGHLVLSTLHTRDAPSAITRLIDMRVEPYMVAAAIDCVVAQRLARTLCDQCKRPAEHSIALDELGLADSQVFEPAGCIRCGWTGYHGRIGLFEVMPVTEEISSLVLDRRGVDEIGAAAVRAGMQSMREDGIEKVKRGLTSVVEVERVTSAL